jgi:glutamate-ammonia-ligase adenylyltransferase
VIELSPLLSETAAVHWQRLIDKSPEITSVLSPVQQAATLQAFALSDYIAEQCIRRPRLLIDLWQRDAFEQSLDFVAIQGQLKQSLTKQSTDDGAKRVLRQTRNEVMVTVAWQELCYGLEASQSICWMSQLADICVSESLDWLYPKMCQDWGTPCDDKGLPQPFVVIGMGKLGGGELNFSSDIDLIFSFPSNGETQGGRRALANQQFFIRMGQRFIQLLDQVTVDGFVFRVDMRLRPFGESGPLAVSYGALEDYYQHHGRDWERYAMVKARCLNDSVQDAAICALLKPFVYRRYIDFSAVQALRTMKAMINSEVRRKGLVDNIKLGAGGIREVEFIVQAFQVIRGGRAPCLQSRSLLAALDRLADFSELDAPCTQTLRRSYLYLRRVENLLQQFADRQTQALPEDDLGRERLRVAMGCRDWPSFYAELTQVLQGVHAVFASTIGDEEVSPSVNDLLYGDLWRIGADRLAIGEFIGRLEFSAQQQASLVDSLYGLYHTIERRHLGSRGRQTLERLMPMLLQLLLESDDPARVTPRVMHLVEQILSRTAYLELLVENPGALKQLIRLCDASALVADKLATFPILLDELLDPELLYNPVSPDTYKAQLREFMLRIPPDDMEQQMEALRQFKQIQSLRVAAADIAGALPLMKVSDHLTAIAEAIVEAAVEQAWSQMVQRFGVPAHVAGTPHKGFAVIGYGKMGGIELGYGSDLDLVFVHNCDTTAPTNGDKPIDSKEFYLKLAQRIMHLFNTRTPSGILYELDMRLRPSGSSGLLVSALDAFERYQLSEAWTWEHQALVRARAIYGDAVLIDGFALVRQRILAQPRVQTTLAGEVCQMRVKMREHLDRGTETDFDLKQSVGGMVDIEFIAQYLVLAHSHKLAEMARWSDNVRIFETAEQLGVLTADVRDKLTQAYLDIRDESHRQVLQSHPRVVAREKFRAQAMLVEQVWQQLLG